MGSELFRRALCQRRDLYLNYQRRYIADHGLKPHDINDERLQAVGSEENKKFSKSFP